MRFLLILFAISLAVYYVTIDKLVMGQLKGLETFYVNADNYASQAAGTYQGPYVDPQKPLNALSNPWNK